MNVQPGPFQSGRSVGLVTAGSGWLWPAALVTIFIVLFYLPAHHATAGIDGLVAGVGALYVLGLSLVGVRLLRGVILRAGGSLEPIVLLGRGPDPLTVSTIQPRWRLSAAVAGAIAPLGAAGLAAWIAAGADTATYAHAIASLARDVNLTLAAGALVPAPGFAGWALLLGIVDAAGTRPDRRVWRAARVAQGLGTPILLAVGIAGALIGNPMLILLSFVLAILTWTHSQLAAAQDASLRFLGSHKTGDIARPITSHAGPHESVDDLVARLRNDHAVSIIEANGGVIGAIGPRQLGAHPVMRRVDRCAEVMIPLRAFRVLGSSSSAMEVLPEIARHGFALVTGADGLGHVEAADLGQQIRIWDALAERRGRRSSEGRPGRDHLHDRSTADRRHGP